MGKKKIFLRILSVIGCILGVTIVSLIGYVSYILSSFYRIGDNKVLNVVSRSEIAQVEVGAEYKAISYNIGFGAYSQDYTFFLDSGYDENGKATCGYYSKGRSKSEVLFNVSGAIKTVADENPDFVCFQEVDTKATRSFYINQDEMILNNPFFANYDHTFALNFHASFLPYPLYDMHGRVQAGLVTMSKYQVKSAVRKSYTISSSLAKLFDLDRCFAVNEIDVNNGHKLYIINSHMSAYDEGGTIRAKQIGELNAFLSMVTANNDYFVVGGDFNHELLVNNPDFSYTKESLPFNESKKSPNWLSYFFKEDKTPVIEGYQIIASDNAPTCRNNDIGWSGFDENDKAKTYICVIDGFIASNNIEIVTHQNIVTKNGKKGLDHFAFADHDPAMITFRLL